MRWVPEEKRQATPETPYSFSQISLDGSDWMPVSGIEMSVTIDTSWFEAVMRHMGEQLSELMRPFAELCKSLVTIAKALNEVRAARVSAMHREYRRRGNARQRRRR